MPLRRHLRAILLIVLCAAFTAVGIAMLIKGPDRGAAVLLVSSFGGGTLIGVVAYLTQLRLAKQLADPGRVSVVGGVPIRLRRGMYFGIGIALLGFGALGIRFGSHIAPLYPYVAGVVGVVGILLLTRVLPRRMDEWFRFDEAGLTFSERRGVWMVLWTELDRIAAGTWNDNPMVSLTFDTPAVLTRVSQERPALARSLHKRFESSQRWVMCDVMLMPFAYGLDAGLLAQAITRYATEPAAREELRPARGELGTGKT